MKTSIDSVIVELDLNKNIFRNKSTGQKVNFSQMLSEGWVIVSQSTSKNKVVYTLTRSRILLENQ